MNFFTEPAFGSGIQGPIANERQIMNNIAEHKKIGEWLKDQRVLAGLSKAQLASMIGHHKSFVGRYEAGQRLDIIQFTRIALALNVEPAHVMKSCIEGNRKKFKKSAR